MNAHDEFARILRQVAPMSELEKAEALLGYFAAALQGLDTDSLRQFRDYCCARSEDTEAENTMLDIIEGQLALRDLAMPRE